TESRFAEVERERVAARSTPTVDEHHLWTSIRRRWPLLRLAVACGPVTQGRAVQQFDEPIRNLSAAVEPLVDHESAAFPLPVELPHELVLCVTAGTLHVNVPRPSARGLIHTLAALLDPFAESQFDLRVETRGRHLACSRENRLAVDGENNG